MSLFILENRWRSSTEEGVKEGTTLVRDPAETTARARRPMTVEKVIVRGSVKNVRVTLGTETVEFPVGVTCLEPPRKVSAGDVLAIDFSGDGSVELAAERVYEKKVNAPAAGSV